MSLLDRFSDPARALQPGHPGSERAKETDRGSHAPPTGDPTLDLDDGALERLIHDTHQALNDLQRGDGHWAFEFEADATIPAEYIMLQHFLGETDTGFPATIESAVRSGRAAARIVTEI